MGDVNITYETLFELLRREKNREDLQNLDETFFEDVLAYLKEKKLQLESLNTKNDLFAADEKKKAEIQDENIRKILRELYERRERKIIALAIDKSRTSESVIDTSGLLREEKLLYENFVAMLDCFRKGILFRLLEANEISLELPEKMIEEPRCEEKKEGEEKPAEEKIKKIRAIEFIPKFVGSDLEEYGPFEANDVAELPEDVAELLIDKGNAEELPG